ncbi:MAG: riboflavin biosynthesis protein RibF [Bacteroidetes bacterium]|nr:bifunctional riboflavin kinase/FAD synthetase [Bacteroidia bacterium]PCH67432.1 MAG: riboflavin biosynthesis protein RibF [Bacteroidota bacterium]
MKIYRSLEDYTKVEKPIVTTGTFDGAHLAHQKIIDRIKQIAETEKGETVLITYWPHPRLVLNPNDNSLKLINSLEEKIDLLETFGIDHLLIIEFTKEFSQISSKEYIEDILVNKIGVHKLVIGYNHHFGRNREGSLANLKENSAVYGFEVEEIPEQDIDDVAVSSTKIREAITNGDINTANNYLGYSFFLQGKVVKGSQTGRSIEFPTANIKVEEKYKIIPKDGVYAVEVECGNILMNGMLNIGNRPTFNGSDRSIEVHIFNFDEDLYDKTLRVNFIERVREELKFESKEELRSQLIKDKKIVTEILS